MTTQNIKLCRITSALLIVATACLSACDPDATALDADLFEADQDEDVYADLDIETPMDSASEAVPQSVDGEFSENELDLPVFNEDVDIGFQLTDEDALDLGLDPDLNAEDFGDGSAINFDGELVSVSDIAPPTEGYYSDPWVGNFWFGDNWWSKSYYIVQGAWCWDNRTRHHATASVTQGNGSCNVFSWYTNNSHDCRVWVRIDQPGWFKAGVCQTKVYMQ